MTARADGDPLLELSGVTFTYPGGALSSLINRPTMPVVDGVSFAIRPGEALGLIGESGSGKTTLVRLILGLEAPDVGTVRVQGTSLEAVPRRRLSQLIQPVFQDPLDALDPRMRLGDQVAEPLVVQRYATRRDCRARARAMIERVGLEPDIADRFPHEISGGQAQRVAIARALALDPALLVCDEPVSALDMSVQIQILNLLKTLQDDRQVTFLFISHDLRAICYLCSRILVMYRGHIVEQGDTEQILRCPLHPYTRTLLAAVPNAANEGLDANRAPDAEPRFRGHQAGAGCPFAPRCSLARATCLTNRPPLRPVEGNHAVACPIVLGEAADRPDLDGARQ